MDGWKPVYTRCDAPFWFSAVSSVKIIIIIKTLNPHQTTHTYDIIKQSKYSLKQKKQKNKKITHEINLSDTNGGDGPDGDITLKITQKSPFGYIMINDTFSIFMINSPINKGVQN